MHHSAQDDVGFNFHLTDIRHAHCQLDHKVLTGEFSFRHLRRWHRATNLVGHTLKSCMNPTQGGLAVLHGHINQVDVHRQAGKVAHEKIDRCPALEREANLCVHKWDELNYQIRLLKKRAGFHGASLGGSAATGTVMRYFGSSRPHAISTRLPLPSDTLDKSSDLNHA